MSQDLSASPEIARALRDTFGEQPIEGLAPLSGGRSGATLLSFMVSGHAYVLRRPDPTRRDHERRAERELSCLRVAAAAGVAPKLHYAEPVHCITIMDKIEPARFAPGTRRPEHIAQALRRLHQGPRFPSGGLPLQIVQHFDRGLRAQASDGLPAELLRTWHDAAEATRAFAESAPCHNDLNPSNILETAEQAFFVDWETATMSDPYFDIGQLGVFMFVTPPARAALLEAYLGRAPTEQEYARLLLGRVTALGFYAAAFFFLNGLQGPLELTGETLLLPQLMPLFAAPGGPAPALVARSFLAEMQREAAGAAYQAAKRILPFKE